jgi:thermitase
MKNLAKAIYRALEQGCHVISISMGGLPSSALHDAVAHAVRQDVIVLAAAGNHVGFVVWPAAYDEVLAVGATNVLRVPWEGSSAGPAVDFCAPGESVWRATLGLDGEAPVPEVALGTGTSFAVATAAGVAALWLAYHNRGRLIERYGAGAGRIPAVFKQLVLTHGCDRDPGWDTANLGAGILNAEKLLRAPLPPAAPARGMAAVRSAAVSKTTAGLAAFAHVLPAVPEPDLRAELEQILETPASTLSRRLDQVGDELLYHLTTDEGLRRMLSERPVGGLPAAPRGRGRARRPEAAREVARSQGVASPAARVREGLVARGASSRLLRAR